MLVELFQKDMIQGYEAARNKGLSENILFVEKSEWKIFVSGFNRNMRNSIAHKTCKVDIIKKTVDFIDRRKKSAMTFKEVQRETREISALLLILPHIFVSVYCLAILSLKDVLENLSDKSKLSK